MRISIFCTKTRNQPKTTVQKLTKNA